MPNVILELDKLEQPRKGNMHRKINMKTSAAVLIIAMSYLPGCGSRLFTPRESNPVLEDYMGTWPSREIASLATRAGHRVNIARMADGTAVDEHKWQRGEFCMEPPPDAMETVASLFSAKGYGSAKATDPKTNVTGEGGGEAEFIRSMATAMAPLLRRSQGLQWARDNMSFLCNSNLNRRLSHGEYLKLTEDVINKSFELIKEEIKHLPNNDQLLPGVGSPKVPEPGKDAPSEKPNPVKPKAPTPPAVPPPPGENSANSAVGNARPVVPVTSSSKLEEARSNSELKSGGSSIKSFFQRLWNWE